MVSADPDATAPHPAPPDPTDPDATQPGRAAAQFHRGAIARRQGAPAPFDPEPLYRETFRAVYGPDAEPALPCGCG